MPINATYEYANAEEKYSEAQTDSERLIALEEMLRTAPTHKGSEKFRGAIRLKIKQLKEKLIKDKKSGKGSKKGIKKGDMQAVLLGLTNSGKSSILQFLTNAHPKIASYGFTTTQPEIGTLNYNKTNIQLIDLPPIASDNFEKGIINTADTILIVIEKIDEIKTILKLTKQNKKAKKIILFNKIDKYNNNLKRKIRETLKSKKYNFVLISTKTDEGLEQLKEKIFKSFNKIRVYTKHHGKAQDNIPVILEPNSTLKDVAEKILHGYSKKVKFAKITGPSSKFSNQKVGLKHIVKDLDVVEFVTE